jgi:hypothetical protein
MTEDSDLEFAMSVSSLLPSFFLFPTGVKLLTAHFGTTGVRILIEFKSFFIFDHITRTVFV